MKAAPLRLQNFLHGAGLFATLPAERKNGFQSFPAVVVLVALGYLSGCAVGTATMSRSETAMLQTLIKNDGVAVLVDNCALSSNFSSSTVYRAETDSIANAAVSGFVEALSSHGLRINKAAIASRCIAAATKQIMPVNKVVDHLGAENPTVAAAGLPAILEANFSSRDALPSVRRLVEATSQLNGLGGPRDAAADTRAFLALPPFPRLNAWAASRYVLIASISAFVPDRAMTALRSVLYATPIYGQSAAIVDFINRTSGADTGTVRAVKIALVDVQSGRLVWASYREIKSDFHAFNPKAYSAKELWPLLTVFHPPGK